VRHGPVVSAEISLPKPTYIKLQLLDNSFVATLRVRYAMSTVSAKQFVGA
jgi:hypothetical protein